MTVFSRAARRIVLALPLAFIAPPLSAQDRPLPPPTALQTGETVPWIYRGSDVPRDREWLFGEMRNGVRYAVRRNGVPPGQVSIRIRIDAGSIHERDPEQGYAHLIEHLVFRQSKHLGPGEAIGRWQALGATFGSDTNAETSPTHTAYKLDLPNVTPAKLEESFRLLAGMMREPALSQANLAADVPIVLAEMRERSGASYAPQVSSNWPEDLASGGTVTAIAQLQPADVPAFFAAADEIARDLTVNPPSAEELQRVTEPLRQLVSRASTGNLFWLYQLEGASTDPRRVAMLRTLLDDYSRTTPDAMQKLAAKYLSSRPGYRIAVLPEGQSLPAGTH